MKRRTALFLCRMARAGRTVFCFAARGRAHKDGAEFGGL